MADQNAANHRQHDEFLVEVGQQPTTGEAPLAIACATESMSVAPREQTAAPTRAVDEVAKAIDRITGVGFDFKS